MRYVQFTESSGSGRKTGNGTGLVDARDYMNRTRSAAVHQGMNRLRLRFSYLKIRQSIAC